jgi:outer membrane autotransporter protein
LSPAGSGVVGSLRADNVTLGSDLSIAGRQPQTRGIFNIDSNNLALNGGTVRFNTFLNDGLVQNTDVLVLNLRGSATTGQANVIVSNIGGLGALTQGNGIELVRTNGGTTTDAFRLGAPVFAGPYSYLLYHGSTDGSAPENWYLRSTVDCLLDPASSACAGPDPHHPNYRPQTSLYAAVPSMALLYGRTLLDTLHERVGDEEADLRNQPRLNGVAVGAWGRIIGQHGNNEGDPLGVFGSGPKFDYNIGAFQGGQDLLRRDGADGSRDHAGLYAAIG